MKKFLFASLFALAFLSLATVPAFAGSVVGLSVSNGGGGPTFVFTVTGEFSPSELTSGFVQVGDKTFQLNCVQKNASTVVCHAPKKAEGNVFISFGGARFWTDVPEIPVPDVQEPSPSSGYCYPVYDFPTQDQYYNEGIDGWVLQGNNCQDAPVVDRDLIEFYSQYHDETRPYGYVEDGWEWPHGGGLDTNPGSGYYLWY